MAEKVGYNKRIYPKEFERKAVEEYYDKMDAEAVCKKYKIDRRTLNRFKAQNPLKLTYDQNEFYKKLSDDFENLPITVFVNKYKINSYKHQQLNDFIMITNKKLIEWLDVLEIPYTKTVERSYRRIQNNLISIEKKSVREPKRKKKIYQMTLPEQLDFKERLEIVDNQKLALKEWLELKEVGVTTITKVLELVDVIARESMVLGIKSTQKGYGEKLEHILFKNL